MIFLRPNAQRATTTITILWVMMALDIAALVSSNTAPEPASGSSVDGSS